MSITGDNNGGCAAPFKNSFRGVYNVFLEHDSINIFIYLRNGKDFQNMVVPALVDHQWE